MSARSASSTSTSPALGLTGLAFLRRIFISLSTFGGTCQNYNLHQENALRQAEGVFLERVAGILCIISSHARCKHLRVLIIIEPVSAIGGSLLPWVRFRLFAKAYCHTRWHQALERVAGIEPASQPWEGYILPLNHTRSCKL